MWCWNLLQVTLLETPDREVVDAWAAHWSPQHYRVTAEALWTDPVDASGPLANAAQVAHRIALVRRSGCGQ